MEVPRLASASSVMNYLVLDLETANGNCASICQLGIVTVEDGIVVGTASHFINPEAAFDPWSESAFWRLLSDQPVVSGTAALATVGPSGDQPPSPER